ncbi:hypothetical protein AVEN_274906-1 [Araneus ventricosus]|uniref:Uncharacterized protein n=1 Tax=Araneus ventricosus TaxID=182803 RepID=A0A4Y2JXE6_ARAVE|nr:hypothetical protein AVEN_274906-1 [Araneus ventricosus]
MTLRRRRTHYQQLTEFQRGRVVWLREGGFSFRDIAERLGRNVSTMHDCSQQRSREGTASRRPGSRLPPGTTEREDSRIQRMAVAHRSAALRARRPVTCIPLTPNHCRLRRQWCLARAHWRTEWRSVVFSDESRFCLGVSDGRVLVRRRLGEHLQPTCPRLDTLDLHLELWSGEQFQHDSRSTLVVIPRNLTANVYVSLVIQPFVMPFINSIQGGAFQLDNALNQTAVVTQHALQSVDMLHWPARLSDLSPIEHVWDIIGRQLQRHTQPVLTVPVLTVQVQQTWNSFPQTVRHACTPTDCERKSSGIHIHSPNFLLHNQISFAENHIDSGAKAIYTDGSKTDEGTGNAYCILENYGIIASWEDKLDRSNSVFQAEILEIRMAIEAASSLHRPIKIWTDSLSNLMAILNPKSHHSMVREIQTFCSPIYTFT